MKCCICNKDFKGLGNSPYGAEEVVNKSFGYEDRCCDECNIKYVISGRLLVGRTKKIKK